MNKIVRTAITYTKTVDCIVIKSFQAKSYSVSFSYGLGKLHKSHRQINYLASYSSYNTNIVSQKSLAIIDITFI